MLAGSFPVVVGAPSTEEGPGRSDGERAFSREGEGARAGLQLQSWNQVQNQKSLQTARKLGNKSCQDEEFHQPQGRRRAGGSGDRSPGQPWWCVFR